MFRSQGNDFNPYLINNNALLPSTLNDGLLTQPAQTVCWTPHVVGSSSCAVLPVYNQGTHSEVERQVSREDAQQQHFVPADSTTENAFHSVLPAVNPSVTYTCLLGVGCTFPLEATTNSLYTHLPQHGHVHKHRDRAPCPWPGCSKASRWGNVARHIIERHLGVKMQCQCCGKTYRRRGDLKVHMKGCIGHPNAKLAGNAYMPHTI